MAETSSTWCCLVNKHSCTPTDLWALFSVAAAHISLTSYIISLSVGNQMNSLWKKQFHAWNIWFLHGLFRIYSIACKYWSYYWINTIFKLGKIMHFTTCTSNPKIHFFLNVTFISDQIKSVSQCYWHTIYVLLSENGSPLYIYIYTFFSSVIHHIFFYAFLQIFLKGWTPSISFHIFHSLFISLRSWSFYTSISI